MSIRRSKTKVFIEMLSANCTEKGRGVGERKSAIAESKRAARLLLERLKQQDDVIATARQSKIESRFSRVVPPTRIRSVLQQQPSDVGMPLPSGFV